jgi:polyhydroxyalkanoate synthesis repressor PhaR
MITIKRYPNRKLYDTDAKQYITLDGIAELIRSGDEIQVIDHATGEDLTSLTLTQIILEQERKQNGFLSNSFLTSLIRDSGDRLASWQRKLRSPQNLFRQIDEEIQLRIQSLVKSGELTAREGQGLLEKLLSHPENQNDSEKLESRIEEHLSKRQVPTQQEIQTLKEQLDQLTSKLEEIKHSNQ